MSYSPAPYSQYPPQQPIYYSATPPAPPPKPSGQSTPQQRGPPLPPPPGQVQNEPSELYGSQDYGYHPQQPQQPSIAPPKQGWMPEILREKATSDLHELLQTPALQTALLSDQHTTHHSIPESQQLLKPLIESNIQLATSLSQLESRLSHQRQQTQSRLLALRALEQQHRNKVTETEDALKHFSPMALYQKLNASVQEQESLLRGMEESFLEEGGEATERETADYVRRVREAKKTAFLRRERRERWDEGRVGGWR